MQRPTRFILALSILAVLSQPASAISAEPEPHDTKPVSTAACNGDQDVTVSLDKGVLTVVSTEKGKTSTRVVDLEAASVLAADVVDDTLAGMDDVFDQLADLQLQCRLGQDNRLNLTFEDTDFELDLDQIMAQVASAVQSGLQEIDTSEWTSQHDRWDDDSDEELQSELADLKAEMEDLRTELRALKQVRQE